MTSDESARYDSRVRALESFGHRGCGTNHERRAAEWLVTELKSIRLIPTAEEFRGSRGLGRRLLAHVVVAMAALALLWRWPWVAALGALLALISLIAEMSTRFVWFSLPVTSSRSQNVVARVLTEGPVNGRIVICAHYDTQPSGFVWTINRAMAPMGWRAPLWLKPPLTPVVIMFFIQFALAAAVIVTHTWFLSLLGILLLCGYGVLALLLLQWSMGRPVPGAADNASGVATVLSLTERWLRQPVQGVELIVLLCGCEESGMLGAAAWLDRHPDLFGHPPTVFLNLDGQGLGPPRILGAEVPAAGVPLHYPTDLLALARDVARERQLSDVGPFALPGPTDGYAFLARARRGLTLVGFRDAALSPHYHTMADTTANMDFASAHEGVEFADRVLRRMAVSFTSGNTTHSFR